ncbi:MAG: hypothetical protein EXR72_08090 [Myxococcales bacterium]|nr:hypothetical protein [Myxococcales bacterium]
MTARGWMMRAIVIGLLLVAGQARAGFPKGTLIITDEEIDTQSATFEKDLKKHSRDTLRKGVEGWKIFLVAYLKRAAGSAEVNLVFYDIAGKGREQVNAFPIATSAKAEILASKVEISPEQGFKVGGKYQVLITRLIGGKEEIYAKTVLSLK